MPEPRPTRQMSGLPEMVEMLLDKGVVVNADVVVTVGQTELLGIKIRAAIASFDTAAKYGLEFPEGTDMDRVERAADVSPIKRPGEAPPESATRAIQEGQRTLAEELDLSMGPDDDGDESEGGEASDDEAEIEAGEE